MDRDELDQQEPWETECSEEDSDAGFSFPDCGAGIWSRHPAGFGVPGRQ